MQIREPIRVAVIFGPGNNIRPVWFDRRNRKHVVLETTYNWADHTGSARRLHFAVRDEGGLYELVYNTADQTWSLEGVEVSA